MATLYARGKKRWRIQYSLNGKRGSITFQGPESEARNLFDKIDRLVGYRKRGLRPDFELLEWIRDIDSSFRLELAEKGLVELGRAGGSLSDLISYSERLYSDRAPRTRTNYAQYNKSLELFFGADRPLVGITRGDCEDFRRWLSAPGRIDKSRGYGPASVAKRIKYSRQVFELAVRKEWLDRNPFSGIRVKVPVDQARRFFVDRETAKKVLEEIPDTESRLVFALGRFAGFRIGSEIRSLTWENVDWARSMLRVDDVKRKTFRECPIFVELRPYLDAAWAEAPEGAYLVCPRFVESTDQAFASRIKKALKRAGVEAWPDLFLNLRRTRATEVVEEFGIKAESEWIGHGVEVSLRHYQIIEQATIDRAIGKVTSPGKATRAKGPAR